MSSVTRQSNEQSDHDDIPNPIPEQRQDTSEDEVAVDEHQEQTDNSNDEVRYDVINNIRYFSFINHYFFTVSLKFYFFVL